MSFFVTEEANDPNLGKFSKVLKCLTREQTNGPGGLKNMDWSQYMGGGGGQFPSNWNRNNNNNNNQQPGWTRPGQFPTNQQGQPQWPQQQQPPPNNLGPQPGQPQPGVHPNDYNIRPQQPQMNNPNWPSRSGQGKGRRCPLKSQRASKFKKVQAKKFVKSNKSKIFFVKLHFWQFQTFSKFKK